MTKVKNTQAPKRYSILRDLYVILFSILFLTIGFLVASLVLKYDDSILKALILYTSTIIIFGIVYFLLAQIIFNEVYKISLSGNQGMFYTPRYVYTIHKKDCVEVVLKKNFYLIELTNGKILRCRRSSNDKRADADVIQFVRGKIQNEPKYAALTPRQRKKNFKNKI